MPQTVYEAYDSAGKRKYLTSNEGRDFLKGAIHIALSERLFCEAMYYLGCRISEAIKLARDDVELPESVIRIVCLKKRGKVVTRRVPVPEWLAKGLLDLPPTEDGRLWPMSRITGWRIIKEVMARAGITGIPATPRALRHSFGVRCALAKIPVNVIQRWLGHSQSITTAIYLAVQDDEDRNLMERTWGIVDIPVLPCYSAIKEKAMNVTIKIDDQTGKAARHMAVDSGLSLSGWVADLIRRELLRVRQGKQKTLLQALGNDGLAEIDVDFPRDQSPMREVNLS